METCRAGATSVEELIGSSPCMLRVEREYFAVLGGWVIVSGGARSGTLGFWEDMLVLPFGGGLIEVRVWEGRGWFFALALD